MRLFLYSHDGMGLGHIRRNLAVAAALLAADPAGVVLLATGTDEAARLGLPPGADVVKLPGLRKLPGGGYAPRRLLSPPADVRRLRTALLTAAVESFRPDVLLSDKHPVGVQGELLPALEEVRSRGGRTVLGLRDILDDPAKVRHEWGVGGLCRLVERHYDRVLVYGDIGVNDVVRKYGLTDEIDRRLHYCGYAARPVDSASFEEVGPPLRTGSRPVVLAAAGGGEDGVELLATFIQASYGAPWDAVVVAGPLGGADEHFDLRAMAAHFGVRWHAFVPNLTHWFAEADALVCMGGYNTLLEAVMAGIPTVCVPRYRPRTEQLIRARAFTRLGLLHMVQPGDLTPGRLHQEVGAALGQSRAELRARTAASLPVRGATCAARHLLELAASARDAGAPLVVG